MGFDRLIDLFVEFIGSLRFCIILDYYERGVHLRKGNPCRVLGPGLWFMWPLIDKVLTDNIKPRAGPLGLQSLLTKDEKLVSINAVITFSISDIQTSLLEVEDVDTAVLDSCGGEIGRLVMSSTWAQIIDEGFPNKLAIACRRRAKEYGIAIERVQLMELTPARPIRLLTDSKAGAG